MSLGFELKKGFLGLGMGKWEVRCDTRNLDYPFDVLADKNVIFHYLDKDFVSVGFPGYIGALSATNYSGISLSSHTAAVLENQSGIPTGILYRKIIEEAESIMDVELILNKHERTIGNNLVISSLYENKVSTFEITSKKIIEITNKDYAVATNHFVSSELSKINKSSVNSINRRNYLKNFYENLDNTNVDKIKATMSFYGGNEQGWSSIANKGTVQSVIFLPEQKTLYVAKGIETPVNNDGYAKYDYSKIITK
jgi:predicted choloylglycine hydrolase